MANLNKIIEQVIGRGIRPFPHRLTSEQRNVTVFMYAAVLSKDPKDRETADLKVYRDAENKDKNMADITHILKRKMPLTVI